MIKLMVVDDHPVFRKGLISVLSTYPDFRVVGEASNGIEAVSRVGELMPDVVLMDIFMRNGDGIEATMLIREKFPEVRVLVISMSENEDDLSQAIKAGANGYLLKSIGLSELVDSVRLIGTGDAVLSPSMATKLMEELRRASKDNNKQELYNLSPREREILQFASHGNTNKEIADKCYISETTVKAHFRNILGKLEVRNRAGAVAIAIAKGLLKEVQPT
jgi:DNA-binding NarL/FixJ family response regulator